MNLYKNYQFIRWAFSFIALIIVIVVIYISNSMVKELAKEERLKVELLADAQKILVSDQVIDNQSYLFLFSIIQKNNSIPVIVTDKNKNPIFSRNIPEKILADSEKLKLEIRKMEKIYTPISIHLGKETQYFYYKNSSLHDKLQYYPILIMFIVSIFIVFSWWNFKNIKQTEESFLWAGMAKETAHQIGTPLSSMMGWIELLKLEENKEEAFYEIKRDIKRLEVITERFSKIGSQPELKTIELNLIISKMVNYLIPRISQNISINFNTDLKKIYLPLNESLFSWVLENLIKNAVDAIKTKGTISILFHQNNINYLLDISDSGSGIKSRKKNDIFKPGFTTKKRGWGLGLSLAKRIIEKYHGGKIYVLKSEINKGTTFRIELKKTK